MNLKMQKRLAAQILKCSPSKVKVDPERFEDLKESITKNDIKSLIKDDAVMKRRVPAPSRGRARQLQAQKRKGRRRNAGSRKGRKTARLAPKDDWVRKVRKQRMFLRNLREKGLISQQNYKTLYRRITGGFFRSVHHLKIYANEFMKKE